MWTYANSGPDPKRYDDITDPDTRTLEEHTPPTSRPGALGRGNRNVTLPEFIEQEIRVVSAIAHLSADATPEEIQAAEDSAR